MLRWIYIIWKYFKRGVLILLGILSVLLILLLGIIQIPATHGYIANFIENRYNNTYNSELSIGKLSGFIPFNMQIDDVLISYTDVQPDTAITDTLITIQSIDVRVNPFDFIRNNISIQSLIIDQPRLYANYRTDVGMYDFNKAFERIDKDETSERSGFPEIKILAPYLLIRDGEINVLYPINGEKMLLSVQNIEMNAFTEISSSEQYFDLRHLFFDIPEASSSSHYLRGQVFNDGNSFEVNALRYTHGDSRIYLNVEVQGIEILGANLQDQLANAVFSLNLDRTVISPNDFHGFSQLTDRISENLSINLNLQGSYSKMNIDEFRVRYGDSNIDLTGNVENLGDLDNITYSISLNDSRIHANDLQSILPDFDSKKWSDLSKIPIKGRIYGDRNRTDADIFLFPTKGEIEIVTDIFWKDQIDYNLNLLARDVNLNHFDAFDLSKSNINASLAVRGVGITPETARFNADLKIYNSIIDNYAIGELNLLGEYSEEFYIASLFFYQNGSTFEGNVNYRLGDSPQLRFTGEATAFKTHEYFKIPDMSDATLDFNMEFELNGKEPDDFNGFFSLDLHRAIVGSDTLGSHQIYADLLETNGDTRELRLTSTVLDLGMRGDIYPTRITEMSAFWIQYFEDRIQDEFLFLDDADSDESTDFAELQDGLYLDLDITFKDLAIIQKYFPVLPTIQADMAADVRLAADHRRISMSGGIAGREVGIDNSSLESFNFQFTSNLRKESMLADFASIDLVLQARNLKHGILEVSEIDANMSMSNEQVLFTSSLKDIGNDKYSMDLVLRTVLEDTGLSFIIEDFKLGNPQYLWNSDGTPRLRYTDQNKLHIDHFILRNGNETIDIYGTLSADLSDSVDYRLDNVDLDKISTLIEGRLTFQGILDGSFSTKSLLREPSISGDIFVDQFAVNNRVMGDIRLSSVFNPQLERFDSRLTISADSAKYASFINRNDFVFQDIEINGWFYQPDESVSRDTLYYFDVDLRKVDGWILAPIIPDIFITTEGSATGSGIFTGNFDDFYFNATVDVEELRAVPVFLLTNYTMSGNVVLDRHDGIQINNVNVADNSQGRGVLSGTVGFNDFQPERPLNLRLEMNSLQFLNNTFEPDIPFYGNISGTGVVTLTGSNLSPFIRTITPITTTTNSRLAIPLLDETTVEEQARFVEFVKSFSDVYTRTTQQDAQQVAQIDDERSFLEVFRLDLQFVAPEGTNVQLVFDPLTGEVLNTRGFGRVRITLEDEVLQMFGNFNVNDGDYTFVASDIFVRRFQLRDGGSINWEGDPANARLNIIAAYRTRPNIGVLTASLTDEQTRIPVDLILEITGTIENIENNFYFEFPNAIDVTQNSTELALLNSEDQKLIQATSLLFTGGFIPVGGAADGQFAELGSSLQSRAGTVGLSQLLSNQINAVLNSNLSVLDIDLNLTGFDQADLGIALRLFDDRLILRGESQFYSGTATGNETQLGDLGVTYRFNRALSLEVFHRRDPTLRSIVGNQAQAESISGVGLEAQLQFNTWRELRTRIWSQIRKIFGYT